VPPRLVVKVPPVQVQREAGVQQEVIQVLVHEHYNYEVERGNYRNFVSTIKG